MTDERYRVDFTFLLRDAGEVRAVHDVHDEGLFSIPTWTEILAGAGFQIVSISTGPGGYPDQRVFVCRKPES